MTNENREYIQQLEETISKFMEPMKDIPFHLIIKSVYGSEVKKLELEGPKDKELINKLEKVSDLAARNAKEDGIFRSRPNEVGNDMEDYVIDGLASVGWKGRTPKRADGKRQSTGYPDIYFEDEYGRPVYFEVKTYNKKTVSSTQRTFYMSPPEEGKEKITKDAFHIVVSFEIGREVRAGTRCYYPKGWKLIDPYSMKMRVKHEFNSSNRELYKKENLIKEAKI